MPDEIKPIPVAAQAIAPATGDKTATVAPQAVIPAVPVTVIGGTGDGGAPLKPGTVAVTPDHEPNLVVQVVTPFVALLIRAINTFLTTLLGVLTGSLATNVITASDFMHLFYKCAGLALAPTLIGAVKDCITIFGRFESKFPLLTGSI